MSFDGGMRSGVLVLAITCLLSCVTVQARECYSCVGEDCIRLSTAGIVKTCENTDDLCFSRYNPTTLQAIERGCITQASVSSCSGDACVSCSTVDLCNDLSSPNHQCAVCSSAVEPNCLANPSLVNPIQCPAPSAVDLTATQCYSRVIGSVTERGCITSQNEVDRCTGLDCATCTGVGCNRDEVPTGRIKCIQCDNAASCNTTDTSSVYCDDLDDVCVTMRRLNGNVMKSCEKAMVAADATFCAANSTNCNFCGKSLCNSVPFTTTPSVKSCYQCEGNNCLKSSAYLVHCRLFDDDCFTTFTGFNPSLRGCAKNLTREELAGCTGLECSTCSESECNLVSRRDHRCAYCSSLVDNNCIVAGTEPLKVVQCPAPSTDVSDVQCYTKIMGDSVTERGCYSSSSDLQGCATDGHNCASCSIETEGEACNSGLFPSDRRRCTINNVANAYCPNPWDDCVQLLQDGARKRTCRSSLTENERNFCTNSTNRCSFCSTDNCNAAEVNFDYIECLSCDSSTDERCATNPAALTTFDRCVTCASAVITSGGMTTTRRGCLTSLPATVSAQCTTTGESGSTCQRCTANRCNVANFPVDRLQCFRCVSPPCISHQSIRLEYCPDYRVNDSCLLQTDVIGQLLRLDCRSSLTTTELAACSGLCQTCSTPGCNDPTLYGTSGSCVQCRSTLNPLCREQATSVAPEPCVNPANAACYSRLVDGATERGCLSDLAATEQSACTRGENCLVCDSRTSNCNTVQYPVAPLTCFQCDSTTDGETCKVAQTGTATECPTYDTANKCYTIVQSNGDTVRKCSTAAREIECASSATCEVCLFRGCNYKANSAVVVTEAPVRTTTPGGINSASSVFSNVVLMVLMLLGLQYVRAH